MNKTSNNLIFTYLATIYEVLLTCNTAILVVTKYWRTDRQKNRWISPRKEALPFLKKIRGQSKKKCLDLGHIEKCGFLHGVQHVSNIIFEVFLGVVKFWPFLLYYAGAMPTISDFGPSNLCDSGPLSSSFPSAFVLSPASVIRPVHPLIFDLLFFPFSFIYGTARNWSVEV